jgi:hypothetical protein
LIGCGLISYPVSELHVAWGGDRRRLLPPFMNDVERNENPWQSHAVKHICIGSMTTVATGVAVGMDEASFVMTLQTLIGY